MLKKLPADTVTPVWQNTLNSDRDLQSGISPSL